MNSNSRQNQQNNSLEPTSSAQDDTFNFDQWAREVKRQMLASLKKRDYEG
jgi:hypothetical protein